VLGHLHPLVHGRGAGGDRERCGHSRAELSDWRGQDGPGRVIEKHTATIMLEGLRQALQARVVNLYRVYSTPNQAGADQRLTEGLRLAAKCYDQAVAIMRKETVVG
ncbi:MAG: hypothetical protein WAN04_14915, partial [Candidatus Udaeobacter sp.]